MEFGETPRRGPRAIGILRREDHPLYRSSPLRPPAGWGGACASRTSFACLSSAASKRQAAPSAPQAITRATSGGDPARRVLPKSYCVHSLVRAVWRTALAPSRQGGPKTSPAWDEERLFVAPSVKWTPPRAQPRQGGPQRRTRRSLHVLVVLHEPQRDVVFQPRHCKPALTAESLQRAERLRPVEAYA